MSFSTGGSSSNLGHSVQYQFDWGDGNYSSWGSSSQSYKYNNIGTYSIKARARCQSHTSVVSGWSGGKSITISGHSLSISISPSGAGSVTKNPDKTGYNHNENVQLTAEASPTYEFDHWGGALTGNTNPKTLTMNGDKSVTAYFVRTAETVSTPNTPSGSSSGKVNQSLSFSTGGSSSNLGHSVQYQFDWGDGNYSSWGSTNQSFQYNNIGTYSVKARARCQSHTEIISNWSSGTTITISGYSLSISISPPNTGNVIKNPDKSEYNHNALKCRRRLRRRRRKKK
ncbi:hypothetical protein H8E88_32610, partial [candidate division KSB1 bacterium]|nr:hypothetical protein [candidate division KSB1 bacterium]